MTADHVLNAAFQLPLITVNTGASNAKVYFGSSYSGTRGSTGQLVMNITGSTSSSLAFLDYIDSKSLIQCIPQTGQTTSIQFVIHSGANVPFVEVITKKASKIVFNITAVYGQCFGQNYNYLNISFFGLRIKTTTTLTIQMALPKEPHDIVKITNTGVTSTFTNWS